MRVLIIDDEKPLVKGLTASLKKEGYSVQAAFDGEEAQRWIKMNQFDIVLLDIMLPGVDGITLLRRIRESSDVPVIMLTAKDDHADMVLGLELGADDYVTKPFNTRVLIARMKTVTRRGNKGSKDSYFELKDMKVDFALREVVKNGSVVELTAKEFDILEILIKNRGMVLSREKIFELVWNEPDFDTRTVDVHISNLREKIEDDLKNPFYIRTKWGIGYFFTKEVG
ncbi:MAG: response regulator transcription factor [Clostridia bacterium]|nr:response regulator transcription factor [Clostridia bacterium]